MGLLKKIASNLIGADKKFTEIVRAADCGEEWAKNELAKMWNNNDPDLVIRVHQARVTIYENAAKNGDRDAILKYARGLAYCGRQEESLQWYMRLINQDDTEAMLELALDYTEYGGLGNNKSQHDYWIHQAAVLGNAAAQAKYGQILELSGQHEQAVEWYRKSAEQGNPNGKIQLADTLRYKMIVTSRNGSDLEIIAEIYDEIENLCIEALNDTDDEVVADHAFTILSGLYLNPPTGVCASSPYRAAYYLLQSAYLCDNEHSMEQLQKLTIEHNLRITQKTLQEWQDMPFDDWAKLYNINE